LQSILQRKGEEMGTIAWSMILLFSLL